GKPVDIPSYLVKKDDVISIKENKRSKPIFEELKTMKISSLPKWLTFNPATLSGQIIALPTREDLDLSISEHMIVELYSK
ncbi:MAG: 30S ribosomal protein S4, partial [Christensenellaceae bacterium]|nr:30S ribosomal protein S4 [Christensenellaceae bacterium]